MILAVDPGTTESALVVLDGDRIVVAVHQSNDAMVSWLWKPPAPIIERLDELPPSERVLAIEMIASYGMPVGREVFETCVWVGRMIQAWEDGHCGDAWEYVYRRDVKLHLCNSARAKDPHVRQALLDRYGGKGAAGTKKSPGPLYGISKHLWSALAVGVTYQDQQARRAA